MAAHPAARLAMGVLMRRLLLRHPVSRWLLALLGGLACAAPTDQDEIPVNAAAGGGGDPVVNDVRPPEATQDTTLDIRVLGANYDRGSVVELLVDGVATDKVQTNSTRYRNSGELIANITIAADATVTSYDVLVTTSRGKKGIGIEKFAVLEKNGAPFACVDEPYEDLPLSLVIRDAVDDAVRSDGGGPYVQPVSGRVGVTANGNLMFWLGDGSARAVQVTTSLFTGATRDRIYTNNHTNPGGDDACGFHGMVPGSTGTAVLEVELDTQGVVRYGKNCVGDFGTVVPGTEATTTRSADGATWTIEASGGVHCKETKVKGKWITTEGTAGPFKLTFTALP